MTDRCHPGRVLARLERPTAAEPTRLAVLSDVHLATDATGTWKVYHRTERHLRTAVERANERDVDGVLVAGDLTRNGVPAEFDLFDDLAAFGPPTVAIPGNHDFPTAFDDRRSLPIREFEARYTPDGLPFRVQFGGLELIGLDSHAATPGSPAETWEGRIGGDQLQWLDDALGDADPDSTIVALHHNLPATRDLYDRYSAELPVEGGVPGFADPQPLVDLLERRDVALAVTGHLHFPAVERADGITELTVPAVSSFPHALLVLAVDEFGTTVRFRPLTDADGMVESVAHGYEKDRVLLSAAQLASFPLVDDFA